MQLQTLGTLRLRDSEFRRPKPLLLLAYLSLEGSKARRYLADVFFMDTTDPLNSLSRALSYLRTEASIAVQADEQKVWTTLSCDAAEFINHADQKHLDKALELYQGPFLESLDLSLGSELEEWVYGTREYLAGRFRNVLLQLAEQEANKGNLSQAAKHAERAYTLTGAPELEPDDIQRLYSFLQAGKSTLASKLKQEAEDFDIDLSSVDLTVHEARETIRHSLPSRATSFVGRDLELVEIARQLANPDIRLLTLHGAGGIGKSRLAVQAAYDQLQQTQFKDGIFFVPLDALASAELIPASIAEALGLELQGQDDTLTQVTRFIGQKHLLLILDNYEHLMAGATLPSKLLSACPNLKLLVTSRERLNLEEEWVMTLEGLSVPGQEVRTFEDAQRFDALGLFVQRAKRARLDFTLSQDDLPHALKICQLVEGSPLGIELAAVWVKMMPLAEISKEIESNLSFLTTTSRNVPRRHQSIKAAFEHSWKLLSDKEQEVLRKLSVFVGGFRREAAAEVAGATLPILASLVDKSLLRVSENGRYDRHVLLHQYANEKLAANEAILKQAQTKHYTYFTQFLIEQEEQIKNGHSKKALEMLDTELTNILSAAQVALDRGSNEDFVKIMRLLVIDGTYFTARAYTSFFTKLLYAAADVAKSINDLNSAYSFLGKLGDYYYNFVSDFDKAFYAYSEAAELTRQERNHGREAVFLGLIGAVRSRQHQMDAKYYLDRAYQLAKATQDDFIICIVLEHIGYALGIQGNANAAQELFLESLAVIERLEKTKNVDQKEIDRRYFFTLLNLGRSHLELKNFQDALTALHNALNLAEERDYQIWMAYALSELGETFHAMNIRSKAQEYFERALYFYRLNQAFDEVKVLTSFLQTEHYRPFLGGG